MRYNDAKNFVKALRQYSGDCMLDILDPAK